MSKASLQSSPVWKDTAGDSPQREHGPLVGKIVCDVAIIGAGFTGIRAALHLAEAGAKVAILDANEVGFGASGRSGGQVNPMLPIADPESLMERWPGEVSDSLISASLNSADELFELIRRLQIDCDARQNGWLRANHCDATAKQSEKLVLAWTRHGAEMKIVGAAEVAQISGSQAYSSGILAKRGGLVHPLKLVRGMAGVFEKLGGQIFARRPVVGLERTDGHWWVKSEQGAVVADKVIVATNGYTNALIPKLQQSILPICPIQIATAPLPNSVIQEILPQGHSISDSRRGIMFARREPDNRIIYGGIGRKDFAGKFLGFDFLRRDAVRVFPQLKNQQWTHQWGGNIALTDDRLPHLHEPKPGLLVGLGYNGRGVAMSHVMGRVLAQRTLGTATDALDFPVTPIQPMPGKRLQQFGFGPALWFMRLMDQREWNRSGNV